MNANETSGRRVLVVDDEELVASAIARLLSAAGYRVNVAHSVTTAIEELDRDDYHVALVDFYLGRCSGEEVLDRAFGLEPTPAILMMSGKANIDMAAKMMRRGVDDFLEKPFGGPELVARLERAVDRATRRNEKALRQRAQPPSTLGASAMAQARLLADRVAATPSTSALIVGESGVGKEIIAARIHQASARRNGPFVRVNLAALSESVIEAELFGSVKGAYTDAKATRAGYLASADGGTILLDEIGEFRLEKQATLLRVLEERSFFPVGSDRERTVDLRVLAATNRNPYVMLETGALREDLFYRLGTIIEVPPLRERRDEIIPLATHFLTVLCAELGRPICALSATASRLLESYAWPGNVRQLRHATERALMLTDGAEIGTQAFDLPTWPVSPEPHAPRASLRDIVGGAEAAIERAELLRALADAGGSRSRAARMMGLSRSTLYNRLRRYGIE